MRATRLKSARYLSILFILVAGCEGSPYSDRGEPYILRHRTLYVVNGLSETLSAIDLEEGAVYNDILELGRWPNDLTSTPAGEALYVVNSGDNQVMEIDPSQGIVTMTADIGIGQNPWACEVAGAELWVSNFLSGEVSIIDLTNGRLDQGLAVGTTLQAILIEGDNVFVTDTNFQYGGFGAGRVIRLDRPGRMGAGEGAVGINPQDLLLDGSGRLHVLCTGDYTSESEGEVHLFDPLTLIPIDTLSLGGSPSAMCLGEGGMIYSVGYWGGIMAYRSDDFSSLFDATAPLMEGDGFTDIVFDPAPGLLYVAEFDGDQVIGIDPSTGRIVVSYRVSDGPLRLRLVEP